MTENEYEYIDSCVIHDQYHPAFRYGNQGNQTKPSGNEMLENKLVAPAKRKIQLVTWQSS